MPMTGRRTTTVSTKDQVILPKATNGNGRTSHFDGRHSDLAFDNPDFELLAKSFRAWGRTVTGPGQLLDALEEEFRQPGPALLAVPVDYAENVKLTQRLANLNIGILP